jgi:hypothetical protein
MMKLNIRQKTYNLFVIIIWFTPILGTASYSRFYHYGLDINLIKILIIFSIFLGGLLVLTRKKIALNSYTLSAILLIYGLALMSDPLEYSEIFFAISYALLIHFLSVNNYQIILKQYLWTCKLIVLIAFIDFISFYILGDHLIAWREPDITSIGIPRLQTIFDEPSHQVFYLLPALMLQIQLFLINRGKLSTVLVYLFPLVMTASATIAIVLIFIAIFFIITVKGRLLEKIIIVLISLLFAYLFFDTFFFKIYLIFYPELWNNPGVTSSSSSTYRMILDVMNSASMMDYMFGVGFYNTEFELLKYLDDESMMPYYNKTIFDTTLNDAGFGANGMVKLLFGYGTIFLSLIILLIYKSKIYSLGFGINSFIIFSMFFMFLKLPHTISLPLAIFFIFGLYQAKGNIKIKLNMKENS